MLNWIQSFNIFSFLHSHQNYFPNADKICLLAAGCIEHSNVTPPFNSTIDYLYQSKKDWLFGHFCYNWEQELENKSYTNTKDQVGFIDAFLFIPELVIELQKNELHIRHFSTHNPKDIYASIINQSIIGKPFTTNAIQLKPVFKKEEFIDTIKKVKAHIKRGDCYELNLCQEWFAKNININPVQLYWKLQQISPTPFSCMYRNNESYALCASPERFLQKRENILRSQPIKGTNKRIHSSIEDNKQQQLLLRQDPKEQAENAMVVDLVRNDLSRICTSGSVEVEELMGVYEFPQVNHLISTIKGKIKDNISFSDIMKALFPMGSMTGAPKKKVMELIEQYEQSRRGLYSGTIGYITPQKDFDFNVVIRSFLYNQTTGYLSYLVGGGITHYSDPEKEYAECLLKAEALEKVLTFI